jgi:hypothetical protein
MAEPTIICPKCKNEIKLTESLAAPLIESTRRDFEQRLAQKDLDVAGREKSIQEREAALSQAKDSLETQVTERVQQERGKIAADEARKAKLALTNDSSRFITTRIRLTSRILSWRVRRGCFCANPNEPIKWKTRKSSPRKPLRSNGASTPRNTRRNTAGKPGDTCSFRMMPLLET